MLGDKYELFQAASVTEAKVLLAQRGIELLLVHRPVVDMEATAELGRSFPLSRIFLLSDRPNEDEGFAFLRLGVVGYANTYTASARLVEAVRVVSSGSVWVGQQVMQRLIQETYGVNGKDAAWEERQRKTASLTAREKEIAELVAAGLANLEIAEKLGISERTVKAHLSTVYKKTGAGSRLNLALLLNRGR
jgi:DNA-binding NarL/FixJ family response regulator